MHLKHPNQRNSDSEPSEVDAPDSDYGPEDGPEPARDRRIADLFQAHNRSLIRFLAARLHSSEEAKEIAQEAYVKLLKLDEPDTVSYLRAFLFRIAANLAADRLKQRKRRGHLRSLVFFDTEAVSPSPESNLDTREALKVVRAAIEELPANCRMAFLLYRIYELPVKETATRMDLSVRMVRLYIARAIAHCRERLDESACPVRET